MSRHKNNTNKATQYVLSPIGSFYLLFFYISEFFRVYFFNFIFLDEVLLIIIINNFDKYYLSSS